MVADDLCNQFNLNSEIFDFLTLFFCTFPTYKHEFIGGLRDWKLYLSDGTIALFFK